MDMKVTIAREPLKLEFEVGSIDEALGTLQDNKPKFIQYLEIAGEMNEATGGDAGVNTGTVATEDAAAPARKGRGKAKNQPDPAIATAPAPMPVPAAPTPPVASTPAAPVDVTPNANGIPAFLDRTANAAPPVAPAQAAPTPPAPPVVAAPPIAPTPPVSVLAPKILAEVANRGATAADQGAAINTWLLDTLKTYGLVQSVATFDEAKVCMPFLTDDKLAPIAQALNVS